MIIFNKKRGGKIGEKKGAARFRGIALKFFFVFGFVFVFFYSHYFEVLLR